jgi:Flp pilus assembly protein TadD
MRALVLGQWDEALVRFEDLLRIDPTTPHAHFYRGVALDRLGRRPEARRAYARCYFHDTVNRWDYCVRTQLAKKPS